ncbi:MAG: hypothetical protein WA989_12395 [Henriciella sp.]|uniref:hypothetical protein n=1 Tax=Henriciella sp. TaxID=1968823 RepID=UPI003C730B55
MRHMIASFALAATGLVALPVSAQIQAELPQVELPTKKPPLSKVPKLSEAVKPGQARLAGCIRHQVYNTQSVNQISTAFTLITSEGDRTFNFEADRIRYIPPGTGLPLPTAAQTDKWDRILDTLERAAAAGKPLLIDYSTPSNEVFGMYVQWSENCP